ncbi:MAG: GAF domain-containing protein [Planctomycetota bacterium]|nr:MAG: GAF domain-containing protein [Planctomycetota bacterium]
MSKKLLYEKLTAELTSLLGDETDIIANCANAAALLGRMLPEINWVGFYFLRRDVLIVGPFFGKPACTRIPVGKGVCGKAVEQRKSLVVPDVRLFPGHIACDAASRSEIVVPLMRDDRIWGVLDVDSPKEERFDEADRFGLERVAEVVCSHSELPEGPCIVPG